MCCIFTCCGWVIDLVQRLWTFTMSCCISSAVMCTMVTASMSGIAMGYNYSLAEYIDLKETNVSIYLKRGVFDDEIADDYDWRRHGGHLPVAGHLKDENLRTAPPGDDESTSLRSGRRLDDSVFEADEGNKYEGSLMKLTAKPPYQETAPPMATEDLAMGQAAARYQGNSLNQMKAIQSLIDSRRAMGTGGTTNSPLATYGEHHSMLPYIPNVNPNIPHKNPTDFRRMMGRPGQSLPKLNPARLAVPDISLNSAANWVGPKNPNVFNAYDMPPEFVFSATYPTAITVVPSINRPQKPVPEEDRFAGYAVPAVFVTRTVITTDISAKKSAVLDKLEKDSEALNQKYSAEGDEPSKNEIMKMPKVGKLPEEDYEDEIKGLPVRKRRSLEALVNNTSHSTEETLSSKTTEITPSTTVKNIFITRLQTDNKMDSSFENNFANNKNHSIVEKYSNNIQQIDDRITSSLEDKAKTVGEQHLSENKQGKSLLDRLITTIETKKSTLEDETPLKANIETAEKIKIQAKRKSFETNIVTTKYISPSNGASKSYDIKQTSVSNQKMLNNISVSSNETGLFRTFVKLLQSTLT